jgi:hypothetical protein
MASPKTNPGVPTTQSATFFTMDCDAGRRTDPVHRHRNVGGSPSYVELFTLEMMHDTRQHKEGEQASKIGRQEQTGNAQLLPRPRSGLLFALDLRQQAT